MAGGGGKYLNKVLDKLIFKINCFCDNDKKKWKTCINKIRIISPSDLASIYNNNKLVCIASSWAKEIAKKLSEMGIKNYIDLTYWDNRWKDNYNYQKIFSNINNLKRVYKYLEDDNSKSIYTSVIEYRLSMDPVYLIISEYEQYFHSMVKPEINDNIIDADAYTGDTAIKFCRNLKNKCKIFSFEPEDTNYKCLLRNITNEDFKNNIIPLKAGLWRENTFLSFSTQTEKNVNSKSSHISSDGNVKVKVIILDSFVKENKIIPSLIKLDIEGAEYEAIQGAIKTIQTFKPKLQICIYHNVEDLWRIPILIKKIDPNYYFYIGHHSQNLVDTVLYAANK
ncbi:hypothetical protein ES708_00540 [subsurface metagenome]